MKALSILMAITLVISTSGLAFAFTSDGTATYSASVTPTTGTAQIVTPFSAALKNIATDTTATAVAWGTVQAKNKDWVAANQYIAVKGFETYTTWGIQLYTDNKATGATPQYAGTGNPAGLVETVTRTTTLPMCWRVVADTKITGGVDLQIVQKYIAADANYVLLREAADYISDASYFAPWFFMLDKGTPDVDSNTTGNQPFGTNQDYATAVGQNGIQIAPDDYLSIPTTTSEYHVYLGAKFINAVAAKTYSTSKLTVEMYHL